MEMYEKLLLTLSIDVRSIPSILFDDRLDENGWCLIPLIYPIQLQREPATKWLMKPRIHFLILTTNWRMLARAVFNQLFHLRPSQLCLASHSITTAARVTFSSWPFLAHFDKEALIFSWRKNWRVKLFLVRRSTDLSEVMNFTSVYVSKCVVMILPY